MTKTERMALIYGMSVGGAALISYLRGRRGFAEIGMDAAVQGGVAGTGINVVLWLKDNAAERKEADRRSLQGVSGPMLGSVRTMSSYGNPALDNPDIGEKCRRFGEFGKLAKEGVSLLAQINRDKLYRDGDLGGVKVGEEPEDPHDVRSV